ncbi:hypothetical protein niasHS_006289 [Heterodera schachtii]|uniref:Uncharacterized protein n=1 Tax=Heterodera schachtii TaxID=97005 RepID=A0ABD2JT09_HETSC
MAQVQLEDFLTPTEHAEWPSSAVAAELKQPKQPESPSKLMARNRLGNLLGQIRKGEGNGTNAATGGRAMKGMHGRRIVVVGGGDDQQLDEMEEADIDSELDDRHGTRQQRQQYGGKRMRREKRVVFELRGKAFGLRDSAQPESVYALCRKWMYGRDEERQTTEQQQDEWEAEEHQQRTEAGDGRPSFAFGAIGNGHRSLDLMATKDIFALPPPRADGPPLLDPRPQRLIRRVDIQSQTAQQQQQRSDQQQMDTLLDDHLQHWKRVKQNWCEYGRKREQRYADSLQLLRTVYGIAQQTQQM